MRQQEPSTWQFVLRPKKSLAISELEARAGSAGEFKHLTGTKDLLLFSFRQRSSDGRGAWNNLKTMLGEDLAILPVFLDSQNRAHYPTGRITLRFTHARTEEELNQFATLHQFSGWTRNKYIPTQITFEHSRLEKVYLPDVLDELSATEGVSACWPETLSLYEKL
jgi:hypothetical protein